jgi:hypothetical protein
LQRYGRIRETLALGLALYLVATLVTIAIAVVVVVRLPRDYLRATHVAPAQRWTVLRVMRNVLGAILVIVGAALSVPGVPGQGLLTVLAGLLLTDVPGKRDLERRLLTREGVFRRVNRLRARLGKPPLERDEHDG